MIYVPSCMKRSFYHLWRGTWQVTKTQCVRPSHQCRTTSSYFFKTAFGFFWFGHLFYRWNSHTCLQWRFDEPGMTSSKACVPCDVFINIGTVGGDHRDGPQSPFQLPSQWWEKPTCTLRMWIVASPQCSGMAQVVSAHQSWPPPGCLQRHQVTRSWLHSSPGATEAWQVITGEWRSELRAALLRLRYPKDQW